MILNISNCEGLMEVTEIKVWLANERKLKAYVSITLENCLAIRNIKVIEGNEGRLFIAMPNERKKDGKYRDIVHPITAECRNLLETRILAAYGSKLAASRLEASGAPVRVLDSQ